MKLSKKISLILALLGVALHFYQAFFLGCGGPVDSAIGIFVINSFPYILISLITIFSRKFIKSLCAGIVVLCVDLYVHYEVFISPTSSTSVLAWLWMPLWSLGIFIPSGMLIGSFIEILICKKKKASP